jgi:hypothetical protein
MNGEKKIKKNKKSEDMEKKKVKDRESKKIGRDSKSNKKWSPKSIYLQQKRIITNEKEKLMTELATIIYDMQKSYQLKIREVYENTVT